MEESFGKYVDELVIPASDLDDDFDYVPFIIPENKEDLYKLRLATEADIATDTVFHELGDYNEDMEKSRLNKLKAACVSEADYNAWKESFIAAEYAKVKDLSFLSCSYMFAGIGQYRAVIPAEALEAFKEWINSNGSAFFGESREATEDEVKQLIALSAAMNN